MSATIRSGDDKSCPNCRSLFDLLLRRDVDDYIASYVQQADDRGKSCGVLLTDPACLPDAESRRYEEIARASRDGYYLAHRSVNELKKIARTHKSHRDLARILEYLNIYLRGREVAVLCVWKGCVAYFLLKANPSHEDEDEDEDEDDEHFPDFSRPRLLSEDYLRAELLGPKELRIETSHQDTPTKVEPKHPVVEIFHENETVKGGSALPSEGVEPKHSVVESSHQNATVKRGSAPSGAEPPAHEAPAVGRPRSKVEHTVLEPRLQRMVLRVPPELQEDLLEISERLFDETRLEYSYAAILRGLIALGLRSLTGKALLAGEFNGTRVMRGRKRRGR